MQHHVIKTNQLAPSTNNFSPQLQAIAEGLEYRGIAVFVVGRYGQYWRWGRWRKPFANTQLLWQARLAEGEQ